MALTLNKMTFGDESRVVFASVPNDPFVDKQIIPGGCKLVLFSYMYLKNKDPQWTRNLLSRTKTVAQKIYIDSGVFSFIRKMKMPGLNRKIFAVPPEVRSEVNRQAIARMAEFEQYTRAYVKFLNDYDEYIDWSFDMDIDIVADVASANRLYAYMRKHCKSPQKIIRIWHFTRSYEDWQRWCDSGEYTYLSLEGAGSHDRDVDFYKRFISYAHARNIKVHVLAMTSPVFLKHVNCDTADSSSWSMGGRYASVYTPTGIISFAAKGGVAYSSQKQWNSLSKLKQKEVITWIRKGGLDYTPEDLLASDSHGWKARNLVNIYYYRSIGNAPVNKVSHDTHRMGILDEY